MATKHEIDVPLVLRHAHDEVLLALFAESDEAAAVHRKAADKYVREAVRTMSANPKREYDWSELQPHL